MQIKNKYFPYPVIAEGNDSYQNSSFTTDANYEIAGHNIVFTFDALLENDELYEMLKCGKVAIAHHIECGQTCFRTVATTKDQTIKLNVNDKQLNGKVEICSFLIAEEDIIQYVNSQFGSDYKGIKFNIDEGCILAAGNQINFIINKDKDELANTSSIFSVRRNFDPNETEVQVNTNSDKIIISIPEKTCNQYLSLSGNTMLLPMLHSMVVLPALMSVLIELKESGNELYLYEQKRWFRALIKTAGKLNIIISQEVLANADIYKLAQQLLDNPLTKALDNFASDEGGFYED